MPHESLRACARRVESCAALTCIPVAERPCLLPCVAVSFNSSRALGPDLENLGRLGDQLDLLRSLIYAGSWPFSDENYTIFSIISEFFFLNDS